MHKFRAAPADKAGLICFQFNCVGKFSVVTAQDRFCFCVCVCACLLFFVPQSDSIICVWLLGSCNLLHLRFSSEDGSGPCTCSSMRLREQAAPFIHSIYWIIYLLVFRWIYTEETNQQNLKILFYCTGSCRSSRVWRTGPICDFDHVSVSEVGRGLKYSARVQELLHHNIFTEGEVKLLV